MLSDDDNAMLGDTNLCRRLLMEEAAKRHADTEEQPRRLRSRLRQRRLQSKGEEEGPTNVIPRLRETTTQCWATPTCVAASCWKKWKGAQTQRISPVASAAAWSLTSMIP